MSFGGEAQLSFFINDIRVPGTFPIGTFLKMWGGMAENMSISKQTVEEISKSGSSSKKNDEDLEETNSHLKGQPSRNNITIPRDIT